jgi:hypothetical protein
MATATRPKMSGPLETPLAPPADAAKTRSEVEEAPVQTWEYVLFWFMLVCMAIMWGIMMLDLFGSGFWAIFDLPR